MWFSFVWGGGGWGGGGGGGWGEPPILYATDLGRLKCCAHHATARLARVAKIAASLQWQFKSYHIDAA